MNFFFLSRILLALYAGALIAQARVVEYDLTVAEQKWSPDNGKAVRAMTINGGIPGPTIRFRVGDTARIRVHNKLAKEETSIHWHGLLVPNAQDGVPYVTTPPIKSGTTWTFEFPIRHAGTYWYHSHTGLQEQIGVYGSIVILPREGPDEKVDHDQVVVLSDWTREKPEEVMRTLMRGSDWYALKKGTMQSLTGAWKAGALKDFWARERSRMPAMDISDIAYDAFLANGQRSIQLPGKPGEKVRLRFINAAASTYFYLESSTGPMRIIAADGPTVKPLQVKRLLVGMAETYDAIVTVPPSGKWEVRATAQDGSGFASMYLGKGDVHAAPDMPRPDLYRMDSHLMAAMEESEAMPDMSGAMQSRSGSKPDKMQGMQHMPMSARGEKSVVVTENPRPLSPYKQLRSPHSTTLRASLPRRTIELRLTGDMERYIWSFNGKTYAEDGVITIKKGEVLRLEFINDTMMHHPLHLHGHFFRVLEGQGDDAPLKHTIDVPPMARRTVEFEANEYGDWLFHCHLLYHMHAGMTRIFSNQPEGSHHETHGGEHDHDPLYFLAQGSIQNHMSMGMLTLMNQRNDFYASWDVGIEHDKSRGDHDHDYEYEADIAWSRYFNQNFSTVLGFRFTNEDGAENRAFAGVEYRLPYLVWSSVQIDSEGDARIGLTKDLQITDRLSIFGGVDYDTGSQWEWTTGAEYTLTKQFSLITQYHSEHGFGGGVSFRF